LNSVIKRSNKQEETSDQKQAGILGTKPLNVQSVAELMLFDSDVNVYEEANVTLAESAEFNVRGNKTKIYN
jgi:lipopolysaccharide export system protein LptC